MAACHGMTATITKSHCYRRRNNKRATKTSRNIKHSTTNIECAAKGEGYILQNISFYQESIQIKDFF